MSDIRVRAGWANDPATSIRDHVSPGLAQRLAQADSEDRRAADRLAQRQAEEFSARQERALMDFARRSSEESGVPIRDIVHAVQRGDALPPGVGMTVRERVEYASAMADVEDPKAQAEQAARYRKWQENEGDLDVPQPSEREIEIAAAFMKSDDDPTEVGKGVRDRWLRKNYQRMEFE